MPEYITAKDALSRDLASAEAALQGANDSYAKAETRLHEAERAASSAYDGRARNQRNVDRIKKAIAALAEGDTDHE